MWKIKKNLVEEICLAAKRYYPKEFLCFLGGNKKEKIIEEIVLLPNTSGNDFASIFDHVIPLDETIIGSIHSHPDSSSIPSKADQKFFQRYEINAIIDGSYLLERVRFFDSKGNEIKVLID